MPAADKNNSAAPPEHASELTAAQQKRVRSLCEQVNKVVRDNSGRFESLADSLFGALFDGDSSGVFVRRHMGSPSFRYMASMCGKELLLTNTQLSRCVRIGCLNSHLRTGGWPRLSWSMKLELLPLVSSDGNLSVLMEGIREAQKNAASIRAIRQWVMERLRNEKADSAEAAPVSATTATRLFAAGRRLKTVSARRRLAERLRKLEPASYSAVLSDIDATLRHLQQLREELEERRAPAGSSRDREARAAA